MPHDHLPAAMRPGEAEPTAAIGLSKARSGAGGRGRARETRRREAARRERVKREEHDHGCCPSEQCERAAGTARRRDPDRSPA